MCRILRKIRQLKRYLVYTTAVSKSSALVSTRVLLPPSRKNRQFHIPVEKVGLTNDRSGDAGRGQGVPIRAIGYDDHSYEQRPQSTGEQIRAQDQRRPACH